MDAELAAVETLVDRLGDVRRDRREQRGDRPERFVQDAVGGELVAIRRVGPRPFADELDVPPGQVVQDERLDGAIRSVEAVRRHLGVDRRPHALEAREEPAVLVSKMALDVRRAGCKRIEPIQYHVRRRESEDVP